SWELCQFGPATKVTDGRNYAKDPHDRDARLAAKHSLKYPPVRFNEPQRVAIAGGFAHAIREAQYSLHALCIGHDHSHAIVARHERTIEQVARHLKSKATMELTRRGVHPLQDRRTNDGSIPTPWAKDCWSVFIDDEAQLNTAIRYVERHPQKEGLAPQHHDFFAPPGG
ncbi:MAG: hypothetical protein ACREJC_18480, partial [Tepidisphaeraceae bacterium]